MHIPQISLSFTSMASLQTLQNLLQFCHCFRSTPKLPHLQSPNLIPLSRNWLFSGKIRISGASIEERSRFCSTCCFCKTKSEVENVSIQVQEENQIERPQFDINLAVILAGFAFEAYTTPPVITSSINWYLSFLRIMDVFVSSFCFLNSFKKKFRPKWFCGDIDRCVFWSWRVWLVLIWSFISLLFWVLEKWRAQ